MSAEISTFLHQMQSNFLELGYLNKGLVVSLLGYGAIRISMNVFKPSLKSILQFIRPEKGNSPTDSKYDPKKLYVHMFPRKTTKQVPNLSPFSIKVETWLRLMKIDYEAVETLQFSNKKTGQIPYLFHEGKNISDSSFIIEYIEQLYHLDGTENLNLEELAMSRALTMMVEESTPSTYFIHRYCYEFKKFKKICAFPIPWLLQPIMDRRLPKNMLNAFKLKGIGRKTPSEVYKIGQEDIRALSRYLGNKKFMMGDKITKVDCAVFGQLSQIVFVDFHYPHMDFIKRECSNIIPYMNRIKVKCWPDWEEIVPKGHFF